MAAGHPTPAKAFKRPQVDEDGGDDAEIDEVDEAVEFGAELAQSCSKALPNAPSRPSITPDKSTKVTASSKRPSMA